MNLTEHFNLSEFTRSTTATTRGIPNIPNATQVANLRALCIHILEPLRQHAGRPIIISSGYRCPQLNAAIGGVANSQHQTGEAADIHIPNNAIGNQWLEWMIDNLHFDQLIKERQHPNSPTFWIHVSYKRTGHNRQQVLHLSKYK